MRQTNDLKKINPEVGYFRVMRTKLNYKCVLGDDFGEQGADIPVYADQAKFR
jgi:hypothetical protein